MEHGAPVLLPALTFDAERREVLALPAGNAQSIGATLHLPVDGIKPTGRAAILIPGWSGPRTGPAELLVGLAQKLAVEGTPALRIDLHGRGDATGRFDDGDLDRMIADASAALDALPRELAKHYPSAHFEVCVGGICSGGNVALGLASLRPKDVASIAALSTLPFQPARTAGFERRRRWKNLKALLKKALKPSNWLRLLRGEVNVGRVKESVTASEKKAQGERNPKDSARNIEAELKNWKGRALFVYGGGDEEAAPARAYFEKLHAQGVGSAARFETVAGANHNFYGAAWREDVARLLLEFLK